MKILLRQKVIKKIVMKQKNGEKKEYNEISENK